MFLDVKYSFTICPLLAFVRPYCLATAVQLIFSVGPQDFASSSNALVSKTDSRRCVLYPCMCAFPSCVFDSFRSTAFSLVSSPNVFLILSNVLQLVLEPMTISYAFLLNSFSISFLTDCVISRLVFKRLLGFCSGLALEFCTILAGGCGVCTILAGECGVCTMLAGGCGVCTILAGGCGGVQCWLGVVGCV